MITAEDTILGFIGAGNMASAILKGVLREFILPPEKIYLSNRHDDKLRLFADFGIHTSTDNRVVARSADLVMLAVKPQMFGDVLPEIAPLVAGKCVVSIAAGISSAQLQAALPGAYIVRAMPNTPLMVGCGATAIARASEVPPALFEKVVALFSAAGDVALIEESQMHDIINVSGSSPAFFLRMADQMVSRAIAAGIAPKTALQFTAKTMEGTARLLLETGKSPEELARQVCSPGGTTLAALSAFDDGGFDELIVEAMRRCAARSRELGGEAIPTHQI